MKNHVLLIALPLLFGCASPTQEAPSTAPAVLAASSAQQTSAGAPSAEVAPPSQSETGASSDFVPLKGADLKSALAGHYMMNVRFSNGAEHFCESGRWSFVGGRAVETGKYTLNEDRYCVVMDGGRRWCAQLSHDRADIYATRYLNGAIGIMQGTVRLSPKQQSC